MKKNTANHKKITKTLRWIARIWGILILAYALTLVIGYTSNWITTGTADPYQVENISPVEALPPIGILISALGLGIAWRWERLGGLIAVIFQFAVLLLLLIINPITENFPRSAIPYLLVLIVLPPGILFLVCWRRTVQAPIEQEPLEDN